MPRGFQVHCLFVALLSAALVRAQTAIQWQTGGTTSWFTGSNWVGGTVPANTHAAVSAASGSSYVVSTSGASANVTPSTLDVTSSAAQLLFDFTSNSYGLTLGTGSSSWSAGTLEFRKASGVYGAGITSTTVSVGAGASVLFTTDPSTRYISSLTLANSGTIQATSGALGFSNVALTNNASGLIDANGAEIDFNSSTTLTNAGTLRATGTGGLLYFGNTLTTAALGNVTLQTGGRALLAGTLDNTSATLAAPSGGSYELHGGTITGGTVSAGALTLTNYGGTLNGVTLADNLTLPTSGSVYLTGNSTFTGSTATLGQYANLYWQQSGSLNGKTITLGPSSLFEVIGANHTLTLGSTTSATGTVQIYTDGSTGTAITNNGTLSHTSGSGNLYAPTFVNNGGITASNGSTLSFGNYYANYSTTNGAGGSITADGANTAIYFNGNLANQGTLTAQNSGQLIFRTGYGANQTTANLGNVSIATGGHAYLNGNLDNTAATLPAPTGGSFELYGGNITGGTTAAGALAFTTSGGTLSGVSLGDNLTLPASASVTFTNGATFTGTTGTLNNYSALHWQQTGTLSGKTLTFGTGSRIDVVGANNTLTLGANSSATGNVQIYSDGNPGTAVTNNGTITQTSGTGTLYASTFTNNGNITVNAGNGLNIGNFYSTYTSINAAGGTMTADGASATLTINGNLANLGTLTANNTASITFQTGYGAAQTTANLGNITISNGGHVYLNGTLDNTGATLNAPAGGSYELNGGQINNGTIGASALRFTGSGGTLGNVTIADNLTLPAGTSVYFNGGSTFTGATGTLGNNASLYWQQTGTLAGKTLTFGSGSRLELVSANNTLTLAANTSAAGNVQIYSDGATGTAVTNNGTITQTTNTGSLYANTFTNNGNITANAGSSLNIGNYYAGYITTNGAGGNITADGANTIIYLNNAITNQGAMTATNSGVLEFVTGYGATQTTANLGNITIANGGHVYLHGQLDNTGATLNAPTGGTFELSGGTITAGTIAANALTFTTSGGTLSGVTLADNLTLAGSTYVDFTGGSSFTGSTGSLGSYATFQWQQTGSLVGKALTLASGARIEVLGANALTLDSTTSVSGDIQVNTDGNAAASITNNGTLSHTVGNGSIYAGTFTNNGNITASTGTNLDLGNYYSSYNLNNSAAGRITADGANAIIYLDGNLANQGTLIAQNNGQLVFRTGYGQPQTTANIGTVQIATGGHVYLAGTLDNSAANLSQPQGGAFELYGGTINNGAVNAGALSFTGYGGTLNGVTINDTLSLPANASVYLTSGSAFTGGTATLGASSTLYWQQAGTLTGKALTFGNGSRIDVVGANNTLTLSANTTATGDVQIFTDGSTGTAITNYGNITHTSSSGTLYAPTFTNSGNITASAGSLEFGNYYSSTNTLQNASGGKITSDGASTIIYLDGTVINQGTLVAQNSGQIMFRTGYGTPQTTANLGTVQISSNGHVYLNGILDNTAATLPAPSGGQYELYGGTINNGTIGSGALTFTSSGGTLSNVSVLGNLTVPANSYVSLTGGSSLAANAAVALGSNSGVYWKQSGTITGDALTFGNGSFLYLNAANAALTLDSATTATGDVAIYSDSSSNTAITNNGTLTHNLNTGYLYASTLANNGTIVASSGTLYLGSTSVTANLTNNAGGIIRLNGGNVAIQVPTANPMVNQGTLDIRSGTLFTNNRLINGSGGVIDGAGTISGNVTLSGGILAPGNSGIGILSFSGGTLTVTNPSTIAVDLGGTTADQLVFQSPPSTVNIGSGLLSLSLNLLSAPTANTTFNLISISSGTYGISGSFAGLPNSGDTLTASFGGNSFTFAVNYQNNLVSLSYNPVLVPEPSTYALIGAGLALLGFTWRRRRLAR